MACSMTWAQKNLHNTLREQYVVFPHVGSLGEDLNSLSPQLTKDSFPYFVYISAKDLLKAAKHQVYPYC